MNKTCCSGECNSLKYSWLRDLEKQDRCAMLEYVVSISLKKSQNLFEQGASAQGFFCIRKGIVKLVLDTGNGESITIDLYSDKGMLGHHCLISATNFYTATCLTDAEVCFIPKSIMLKVKPISSSIDANILGKIGSEYVRLNEVISSLRTKSVLQRTAEVLVRLQAMFGNDAEEAIKFYVTKEELANIIGSSVESVFRTLATLKQKKYIDFEKSRIWIRNPVKLQEISRIKTLAVRHSLYV